MNNHEYARLDILDSDELHALLRRDSLEKDTDVEKVLYILRLLEKRGETEPVDVDAAWKDFRENYLPGAVPEDSAATSRRPLRRVFLTAAVIAAFLLFATIVAAALGVDVWGHVARWTSETFHFSMEEAEPVVPADVVYGEDEREFADMQTALDAYGVTEKLVPAWMPEGYELTEMHVAVMPNGNTWHALYTRGEDNLIVSVRRMNEGFGGATYEKDDGEVTVYEMGGVEHYLMTNLDYELAVWTVDDFECSITGSISRDELIRMVDSIYG